MTLITILFCLALQRYTNTGGWFNPSWFTFYLRKLTPWLIKINPWLGICLIVAPLLLALAILNFAFSLRLFGMFNLILGIIILLFCLDARDLKNKLIVYFNSLEKNNLTAATAATEDLIDNTTTYGKGELERAVTTTILTQAFEKIFAGLFWFMIFGTYGIVAYFAIHLTRQTALSADTNYVALAKIAGQIQDILDWIPSRLVGFSYALAGNFNKGFSYCTKHFWLSGADIKKFPVDAGLAALEVTSNPDQADAKENHAALDLINRTLIIWLAAILLITIGSWL